MMTIDEMIEIKKRYGLSYEYIAEKSGVPMSTVQKVFSRTTPTPRMSTLTALNDVFDEMNYAFVREDPAPYDVSSVKFHLTDGLGALSLDVDNSKTIDDYMNLPEGERVELIDGVFYDMAAPIPIHQKIASLINTVFENFVKTNKGSCVPFIAPSDVQLDCDNKTVVQPDLFVVCDRNKITKKRIVGAPDLVIEILSESNWYTDIFIKRQKYKNAGVKEYWIVMPDKLRIQVYCFEKSDEPTEYTFTDKIPISIWGGKCVVDFADIYTDISFML